MMETRGRLVGVSAMLALSSPFSSPRAGLSRTRAALLLSTTAILDADSCGSGRSPWGWVRRGVPKSIQRLPGRHGVHRSRTRNPASASGAPRIGSRGAGSIDPLVRPVVARTPFVGQLENIDMIIHHRPKEILPLVAPGTGVIWSAVIPAKAGIHAATMAPALCTSPSGLELLGSNESNLPLDSSRHGGTGMTAFTGPHAINFP